MTQHIVDDRDVFMLKLQRSMLLPGSLSEDQFYLLIRLSSIRCDRVILAMKDYLVEGQSRRQVCEHYNMNNGYFSITLNRIVRINMLVSRLASYYSGSSLSAVNAG